VFLDDRRLRPVASRSAVLPGTVFWDAAAGQLVLGDDPTGRRVEVATATRAFSGGGSVTVQGLTVEKFANPAQSGAFHIQGSWTIVDNLVRWNHGAGICGASGSVVEHNEVRENGQLGLCGTSSVGARFEANVIVGNNTAGFKRDWEAGGAKWVATQDLVVRGNYVTGNDGPGLWTDIDNIRSTIEDNYVTANNGPGIFHEISYDAAIRHNAVLDNYPTQTCPQGGWCSSGIRISESSNVLVEGNVVRGAHGSILGIQAERGSGAYGAHLLSNVTVRDNDVTPGAGRTGVMQNTGDMTIFGAARGNTFTGNRYHLRCSSSDFAWANANLDFAHWRAVPQDATGSASTSC
jgi:hypothetical protein